MPQQPRNAPSFAEWRDRAADLQLKRKGRELVGPCPSCGGDDRFSVTAKNGRAVFQCRQCNPGRDNREAFLAILKAAGLAEERESSARTGQRGKPKITHVYSDPTGKPYHRVYRRGSGPDKKVWQDAGYKGRFFPYQIEHLPDIGDRPIVILEGERCVDHLARLGYAAVTWCGGAGQETRTKWGALAGHPVILWPDNDASGTSQRAMQKLADILEGFGCDLKLVSIPEGKPDKWDAADATDKEIHGLIEEAKPIEDTDELAPPKDGARGEINGGMFNMSMGDFLDIDIPPPTWLLENMLTEAGLAILGAKPKVGKSTFTRSLAVSVARGENFLGRRTKQGPVCYGGFEEDPSFVKAHLQTMGVTKSDPIYPFLQPPPKNVLGQLEASIERIKPTLVILDPLVHLVSIADENKYFEMHNALAPFSALARRHRTCVLLCHHNRKSEGADPFDELLGSTAARGNVDTTLHMRREGGQRVLRTEQRYGDDLPQTVLALDPDTQRIENGGAITEAKARELKAEILEVIASHDGPMKKGDIEKAVEGKHERKRSCLDEMCKNGVLESRKQGSAILYQIPQK